MREKRLLTRHVQGDNLCSDRGQIAVIGPARKRSSLVLSFKGRKLKNGLNDWHFASSYFITPDRIRGLRASAMHQRSSDHLALREPLHYGWRMTCKKNERSLFKPFEGFLGVWSKGIFYIVAHFLCVLLYTSFFIVFARVLCF